MWKHCLQARQVFWIRAPVVSTVAFCRTLRVESSKWRWQAKRQHLGKLVGFRITNGWLDSDGHSPAPRKIIQLPHESFRAPNPCGIIVHRNLQGLSLSTAI